MAAKPPGKGANPITMVPADTFIVQCYISGDEAEKTESGVAIPVLVRAGAQSTVADVLARLPQLHRPFEEYTVRGALGDGAANPSSPALYLDYPLQDQDTISFPFMIHVQCPAPAESSSPNSLAISHKLSANGSRPTSPSEPPRSPLNLGGSMHSTPAGVAVEKTETVAETEEGPASGRESPAADTIAVVTTSPMSTRALARQEVQQREQARRALEAKRQANIARVEAERKERERQAALHSAAREAERAEAEAQRRHRLLRLSEARQSKIQLLSQDKEELENMRSQRWEKSIRRYNHDVDRGVTDVHIERVSSNVSSVRRSEAGADEVRVERNQKMSSNLDVLLKDLDYATLQERLESEDTAKAVRAQAKDERVADFHQQYQQAVTDRRRQMKMNNRALRAEAEVQAIQAESVKKDAESAAAKAKERQEEARMALFRQRQNQTIEEGRRAAEQQAQMEALLQSRQHQIR